MAKIKKIKPDLKSDSMQPIKRKIRRVAKKGATEASDEIKSKVSEDTELKDDSQKTIEDGKLKSESPTYNVDLHPETGVMLMPELLYYKLFSADLKVKLFDRELALSRTTEKDLKLQYEQALTKATAKTREVLEALRLSQHEQTQTIRLVEKETGLVLKDWVIDDQRVLRPIDKGK